MHSKFTFGFSRRGNTNKGFVQRGIKLLQFFSFNYFLNNFRVTFQIRSSVFRPSLINF